MAFPKQSLLGVRVAIPRQHVKKVRKDLLMRVRMVHGETAQELAKRAKVALRDMGFILPQTPLRSQEEHPKHQAGKLWRASAKRRGEDAAGQSAHRISAIGEAPGSKPSAIGGESLAPDSLAVGAMSCSAEGPWRQYEEQEVCFRASTIDIPPALMLLRGGSSW